MYKILEISTLENKLIFKISIIDQFKKLTNFQNFTIWKINKLFKFLYFEKLPNF